MEPDHALAYSGIADCYALLYDYDALAANTAVPKARAEALKAIQIDNTLAEPHCSLAYVELDSLKNGTKHITRRPYESKQSTLGKR